MPYSRSILSFDFMGGPVPEDFETQFQNVADRARHILAGRTRKQVQSIVDLADFLLDTHEFARKGAWERIDAMVEEKEPALAPALDEDVEGMLAIMEKISLEDYQDIPGLRWEEVFATLGLTSIAAASLNDQDIRARNQAPEEALASCHMLVTPYLAEAVEAVSVAEGLIRQRAAVRDLSARQTTDAAHPIRLQAKAGAIKRHEATNQLKRECIIYYQQHSDLSMREAARRFYEGLPSERQILARTNALRTLTEALSDFVNDRLAPHVLEDLPESAD